MFEKLSECPSQIFVRGGRVKVVEKVIESDEGLLSESGLGFWPNCAEKRSQRTVNDEASMSNYQLSIIDNR